jgi:Cdc6-like AAA superfamily ATPase
VREYGFGDARYALELLMMSGLVAERENSSAVLPEAVREAQSWVDPRIGTEDIDALSCAKKYVLLAIVREFKKEKESVYIPLAVVYQMYGVLSEEYGFEPVGEVYFQSLIGSLKDAMIIDVPEDDGDKIGLPGIKIDVLERALVDRLRKS